MPNQHKVNDATRILAIQYHGNLIPISRMESTFTAALDAQNVPVKNFPKPRTCANILQEGGVLALAEMGSMLYDLTHTRHNQDGIRVVAPTCTAAKLTFVVDAASIKEKKLEGFEVLVPVTDPVTGERRFQRLMLGLYELPPGTDKDKMIGFWS